MSGFHCPRCNASRHIDHVWTDRRGIVPGLDHCWKCGTLVDDEGRIDLDLLAAGQVRTFDRQ